MESNNFTGGGKCVDVACAEYASPPRHVQVNLVETSGRPGGMQLVNPDQVTKASDPTDLVELARQIQKADEFVRGTTTSKLSVIVEQMRFLQEQARRVLEEANRDNILHHVACNFKKVAGKIYYLYERPSGQKYFSMLSPREWGVSCPHTCLGAYRLEVDMSWTPSEKIPERSDEMALLEKIMNAQKFASGKAVLEFNGPLSLPAASPH